MLTALQKTLGIKTRLRSTSDREVLFTFDDGPHPSGTARVLDALDEVNAKAVFFVVGGRIQKA